MMILNLKLPSEQQAELERLAAAVGMDPAQFVLRTVQEHLQTSDNAPSARLTGEQWSQRFQDWINGQHTRNPRFDDSRESIYR